MSALIVIPLWQALVFLTAVVLVVAPAVGIPSAIYAARYGAKLGAELAVEACAKHWQCPIYQAAANATDTADLEEQLLALRAEHPEIAKARAAMLAADKEAAPAPPRERARAKKDEEGQR